MIDIHSHLIFAVDDGPSTLEESMRMVAEAEKLGIKVIIATPHFQKNFFNNEKVVENFRELVYRTRSYNVKIKLGNEVFITTDLPETIGQKEFLTLNDSRYLLLDLPFDAIHKYFFDVIYQLQLKSIIPVIAHPERNKNFAKNVNTLIDFVGRGCLIQVDAASITGVYGRETKEFAKEIIKLSMAHFVASNAHCAKDYTDWYKKAYQKAKGWAGVEYAVRLFNTNPSIVLRNKKEIFYKI